MITLPPAASTEFLTISDVAELLQLSTTTIWRHIRTGKIKAIKIGRSYRIRRTDLEAMLRAAEVETPGATPAESPSTGRR